MKIHLYEHDNVNYSIPRGPPVQSSLSVPQQNVDDLLFGAEQWVSDYFQIYYNNYTICFRDLHAQKMSTKAILFLCEVLFVDV